MVRMLLAGVLIIGAVGPAAATEDGFTEAQAIVAEARLGIAEGLAQLQAATDATSKAMALQLVEQAIGTGLDRLTAMTPDACWAEWHRLAVVYLEAWARTLYWFRQPVPGDAGGRYAATNYAYGVASSAERVLPYYADAVSC